MTMLGPANEVQRSMMQMDVDSSQECQILLLECHVE